MDGRTLLAHPAARPTGAGASCASRREKTHSAAKTAAIKGGAHRTSSGVLDTAQPGCRLTRGHFLGETVPSHRRGGLVGAEGEGEAGPSQEFEDRTCGDELEQGNLPQAHRLP